MRTPLQVEDAMMAGRIGGSVTKSPFLGLLPSYTSVGVCKELLYIQPCIHPPAEYVTPKCKLVVLCRKWFETRDPVGFSFLINSLKVSYNLLIVSRETLPGGTNQGKKHPSSLAWSMHRGLFAISAGFHHCTNLFLVDQATTP